MLSVFNSWWSSLFPVFIENISKYEAHVSWKWLWNLIPDCFSCLLNFFSCFEIEPPQTNVDTVVHFSSSLPFHHTGRTGCKNICTILDRSRLTGQTPQSWHSLWEQFPPSRPLFVRNPPDMGIWLWTGIVQFWLTVQNPRHCKTIQKSLQLSQDLWEAFWWWRTWQRFRGGGIAIGPNLAGGNPSGPSPQGGGVCQ